MLHRHCTIQNRRKPANLQSSISSSNTHQNAVTGTKLLRHVSFGRTRMSMDERFDEVLLNLAGNLGGIEPLFDTIFSFLYRKTDYFHVMKPGDKIGFKAGVAQQILLRSFGKFEQQAALAAAKQQAAASAAPAKPKTSSIPQPAPTPAKDAALAAPATPAAPTAAPTEPTAPGAPTAPPSAPGAPSSASSATQITNTAAGSAAAADMGVAVAQAAGAKSSSHLSEQLGVPYNGGRCANFWWEQTLGDVTINAPVPSGTSARDVVCVIGRSHLTLKLKGTSDALIDADYPCDARNGQEIWERVKTNECYWSLGESRGAPCVCIYLEKERECWWKSAVHGAEEIDTTKVDSTRDLYTYDDETQGAIRKIMFDQHQKRLGKATSDELKNEDMLRKAWDAEGSPFKGQPFDPSLVNSI